MNYSVREMLSAQDAQVEGEKLRLLAIGSREAVIETIQTLHSLGYAEVGMWSPLLPAPTSGEVMSILTRKR